ncbi:hypothetical protein FHX06_003395 [Rhizobium sp. BK512]|uniref:argonaute/piwi family protein n=1 Tax=Rhizobium sp. BK512 TaxID=2587010 RepID=UPI001619708E|nr:Piwi domain-containing protein [Rhizobium sp. BK512]MBB3562064.1 hypothetical protein [Rhizobium sp. BK512]
MHMDVAQPKNPASKSTSFSRSLLTNGFLVKVPDAVEVVVRDFLDGSEVKAERERLGPHWFLHWSGGQLYHLRLKNGGPNVQGRTIELETSRHPWLLRSRIEDAIDEAIPSYTAIKKRPFTFLAQKSELLDLAAKAVDISHPLLPNFRISPKFVLNTKIFEDAAGHTRIGIFVTIGMRYEIDAGLEDLIASKVDVSGMYVVRRVLQPGERRLLGRIRRLDGKWTHLVENAEDDVFETADIKLEGSKENFSKCLSAMLGTYQYRKLLGAIDDEEARFRLGPELDKVIEQMGTFLQRKPIPIARDFDATVGDRIVLSNSGIVRSVYRAPTVEYVFDRTGAKSSEFAWAGLARNGPYDRTSFANKSPRILVAFPSSVQSKVETFLRAFREGLGADFRSYEKGFRDLFGLVGTDFVLCPVDVGVRDSGSPYKAYRTAMEERLANAGDIHAAIVVLFDEHAFLSGIENPYIQTKSLLLTLAIPTQELRFSTLTAEPRNLQYTLQNFSVALYAKLNGIPWTVNHDKAIDDELVVGMGVAEMSGSRAQKRQRLVGITTVFSGDGTYLLGNVSKECAYEEHADAVRESLTSVLQELKRRNNWQPGDTVRVIFHANKPLRRIDIAKVAFDCARAVGGEQNVQMAFVTISHDHPFALLDRVEKGEPVGKTGKFKGVFAPARGTIAKIGPFTRLMSVNAGKLIKRPNSPLPMPLLVSLHPDSTFKDVDYLAEQALKFTSLSWRSILPAGSPVTIYYSERIAELLGRLKEIPDWSPSALNVKLKWSRWFL